ncbi:xylose repressor [Enterococcus phoeniculicola]|jgi:predicted NBD/HSP70 family sugar kinase|uniref:Xylose repressor n=1 Tax=Enterococcus phoeniculicola ATCC BAA-412 TaxID=1158610 RepID=R3U4C7_9ENTE|nr:ROK family protein [Enterococcus phoeniculicola]EOL48799.1 xylose repressor [Enterococcus phoeniculicola ATCC BAA-412]EOT72645.1 xylose repressor [Enterococcus phoeniculicola ATCC BAA-412]OJG71919.1 xylose repressor [Enterococcus phoeniculicola]
MISSKYTIREQNEAKILNQIIKSGEISRAELSQVSFLNKASVSSIIKKLIDDHLVIEQRIGEANTRGRKPILLTFNAKSALIIGIDLGYDYIDAMISYLDGSEIARLQFNDLKVDDSNVFDYIESIVTTLRKDEPSTFHGVIGMTIAIQGQVLNNTIITTSYYRLSEMNLIEKLNAMYSFPVSVENEANLSALGEYTFSSEFENLISISLHSGIGAGIVKNGKLEIGNMGYAGQLGHMILFPDGRPCPCGNSGCLEQYCSTKVIYQEISEKKNLKKVNSDVVAALYNIGDADVVTIIEKYANYLTIAINNTIMLYAPELVILNSTLTKKIPNIVTIIQSSLINRFTKKVHILQSPIEWNPVIYGAIAHSAQAFLNIEQLKLVNHRHIL